MYSNVAIFVSIKVSEQKSKYMVWKGGRGFEIGNYLKKYVILSHSYVPQPFHEHLRTNIANILFLYPNPLIFQVRFISCQPKKIHCFYIPVQVSAWVRKPEPFKFFRHWTRQSSALYGMDVQTVKALFDLTFERARDPVQFLLVGWEIKNKMGLELLFAFLLYLQFSIKYFGKTQHLCLVLFRRYNWLASYYVLGTDLRTLNVLSILILTTVLYNDIMMMSILWIRLMLNKIK